MRRLDLKKKKEIVKTRKKIISIPPVYFFFCIALSTICYFILPDLNGIYFPYNLIMGIPLIFLGTCFILSSHFLLEKYNTPEKFQRSTCVVKNGVYKYSRNPMYLGFVIFLIGLSFSLCNLLSFISPIIFFSIINWMFIPFEEEKMKKELKQEYLYYKNKVRRWI